MVESVCHTARQEMCQASPLLLQATSLDNRNQQGLAGQYVYSGRVQLCSSLKYAPVSGLLFISLDSYH